MASKFKKGSKQKDTRAKDGKPEGALAYLAFGGKPSSYGATPKAANKPAVKRAGSRGR